MNLEYIHTKFLQSIKNPHFWVIVLLAVLSYGQILFMYFWQDDYTILYTASQNKLFDYPYQVNTLFVKFVFNLFGLNPLPYFIIALILFIVSSFTVRFFIYTLTEDSYLSFLGAIIYTSGYIGQAAMKMFLGTGIVTLPALIFFLLSISYLIKYLNTFKSAWFWISLGCFFLTLEIAPHRHATSILVVLGITLLFFKKGKTKEFILINCVFALVTFLELFLHPTKVFYDYPSGTMGNISAIGNIYQLNNLLNYFASFSNLIVPSNYLQNPVLAPFFGIVLTFIVIYLSFIKKVKYSLALKVFLVTVLGSLLTFYISKPDTTFESDHRYLLTISYAGALIPMMLINAKKRKHLLLFSTIFMVIIHLYVALTTQAQFVKGYSIHARNIYNQLKESVPKNQDMKLIYIEGATRELNYSVGDALRVGTLPSEAALALHFDTTIDRVVNPQRVRSIPSILKSNPEISMDNIYTFIYDGNRLLNTSSSTRDLIINPNKYRSRISTLLPLNLKLYLESKASSAKSINIIWEYNTSGSPLDEKSQTLIVSPGQSEMSIFIPGGGEYLKEVKLMHAEATFGIKILKMTPSYDLE